MVITSHSQKIQKKKKNCLIESTSQIVSQRNNRVDSSCGEPVQEIQQKSHTDRRGNTTQHYTKLTRYLKRAFIKTLHYGPRGRHEVQLRERTI